MFFQRIFQFFAFFLQKIGRLVASIRDAYFCTKTGFLLPALIDIFIIVIIPGVLPPFIGLPIALFRLMDHFIPYCLWPSSHGKITLKHEVYDPLKGYKTRQFHYLVARTLWGDYLLPIDYRWEVTDELHPAGFYRSRLVEVSEETFDLPPTVEKAVRKKLQQKQRLFGIRDAIALLLLYLTLQFLYYDWRLLVGFTFNILLNSIHFILLLIKPQKNVLINIFLITLSIWLTRLHSLLFMDPYADWAIRVAVGLTGVTRNLIWVCCLGILMCVYYTYWNLILWIRGAANFIHYYSTILLFLSPILIFFFFNQLYHILSIILSSINHPDLFRIHDILNEVPRKNFRKLNNTFAKREVRGSWAIRDKVFFPKVEGFLKDVDSRIRNNLKEMKNLLNLPEQLSYTEANYVRYSKLDEIIGQSNFDEFKPIFDLTEEQREKLRRDAKYQKFVREMPGYVNVVGETNSSWKQRPLKNVLANLPKNVFDPVYNTTYLCDKEYQILSTSRYTKTEEECTYDWTTRLDEVYELVKPWVENSRLTSFEKVLKDYVFKYNLGFGAQFKGRALKRSRIFTKFGGAIADRTGLKKYFIEKIIPNLNNFAQIAEVFMKEEIQPMLKWPKCRTILGSNFFFHLPALMVGSEPNHRARWQDTPICVGMPLTGRYLKPIFTEVLACYKRVAGDMTAYDSSLPSPLLDLMRDIRKKGFEKHENREAIHSFLNTFYETLKHDPMHIKDGGLLVEKGKGLATGYPYTSYDNSFTFQAVLYVAIKDVLPHLSVEEYKKKFLIRDYADDNFICWREKLIKPDGTEFEFSDIQHSLLKYNIKLKCENENPETGLPDDRLLSFLGNNYRHPTEEERKEYGLDLVIYHDEKRLLNKFQMNFKARSPLRQLERCSGYLLNCAHLPHAYQIIRDEVEEIVRKHPELKKTVHYRNASLTMPEVIRKWYSPLKKHEIKLLQFIHADFQFQEEDTAMFNHWSLYDYVCYWEELVSQIPLALSGIGMNYIGAFNYTYLNRFNLTRFIASLCIHYQTEISGVTPYLQRLHLDFIDIEGIFKDHLVVTEINSIIKEASGWTQDHRLAYTGGTRNALKIFHLVDYFIPGMPVLNVFRAITSLFNLSLSKIASLNFLLTSEVLDYNEYTIFNPIRAFVFTLLLPFIHHNAKTDISKNFLQDIVDELDVGFLDLVDYNLGAVANLIKYNTIEEVKKEVDQKMIFDKVIETMLKSGRKGKGRAQKHPLITGRTGFGKSTKFLWRMLKHKNINKVICIIPKRVAVLSILRYALQCGINAGAWTEGSPKTHGNLIYTTLDAFMLRYDTVDENTWICIDEAHFELNGYGDGVKFLGSLSKFSNIAYMTATPNEYIKETSYDVFESLKDQLGDGSAADLKVYGPFPVNWSDYMRICRQEVKKVTHDRTLIFVNTLNQQKKLVKAGPFRKTYILNSKAGDPFLDPEFEKASLYITTSICDCSITIPGITKVITHDLIADSNNEGTAIDIYTTDTQTLKQRAGRAGRDCPGEAFLYHIVDKSSPKPQRSLLKKYEDTKQLLTNQTYYESLTAEDKRYYRLNKGLLGPLSVEEFLNSLDSESVNQKLSTEEIQPQFQLQDSDFSCKMSHDMFMQVRQGLKIRDLRLNDPGDRFSLWKVNDLIKIYDRANSNDFIQVRIKQVKLFNNLSKAIKDDLHGLTPNKTFNETYTMFKSFPGYEKNSKVFGCLVFCFELT